MLQMKLEGHLLEDCLLLEEGWSFVVVVLFRPSADWVRPTHIMESNLLYSKVHQFKCLCHLKTLPQKHLE